MAMLGPVRTMLRDATAEAHERLHGQPGFARLAAERIDRPAYGDLLARLLGFHAPLDAALSGAAPGLHRPRAPLLRADLHDLGWGAGAVAALPCCAALPALAGPEEALGALYVIEGSALGGQALARHAGRALFPGLPPPAGRRFLLGHRPDHGAAWREFCAVLEQAGRDGRCADRMAAAACETFRCLDAWLGTTGAVAR